MRPWGGHSDAAKTRKMVFASGPLRPVLPIARTRNQGECLGARSAEGQLAIGALALALLEDFLALDLALADEQQRHR